MTQCQGTRSQMVRLFLVFTYIWPEDFAKISKVPRAPINVNSALSNLPCQFFRDNTPLKKSARENAH